MSLPSSPFQTSEVNGLASTNKRAKSNVFVHQLFGYRKDPEHATDFFSPLRVHKVRLKSTWLERFREVSFLRLAWGE